MLCVIASLWKHSQQLISREYEADEWRRELNHVADFEAWDWSLAWEWNNTSRIFTHKNRHKSHIQREPLQQLKVNMEER